MNSGTSWLGVGLGLGLGLGHALVRARVRARARARARVGVGVRVLGLGLGLGEGEAPRSPGAGERDDLGEREAYALARGVRALGPVGEAHLCVQRRLARLRDG